MNTQAKNIKQKTLITIGVKQIRERKNNDHDNNKRNFTQRIKTRERRKLPVDLVIRT